MLVRLSNNTVSAVNKQKLIKPLMSQLAEASGQMNVDAGTIKLQEIKPEFGAAGRNGAGLDRQ